MWPSCTSGGRLARTTALLCSCLLTACGGGTPRPADGGLPRDGGPPPPVTLRLSLAPELCALLQSPTRGGGPMDGTLVSTTAPGFIASTTFELGQHPCAPGGSEIPVRLPGGEGRTLSIDIVGRTLLESRPDLGIDRRTVFFGGAAAVAAEDIARGEVSLFFDPHVNLVLEVPPASRVRLLRPLRTCVAGNDEGGTQLIVEELALDARGRVFAAIPYSGPEVGCVGRTHGNELFAFIEAPNGEVALFVPGRALSPGAGLDPGMLVAETLVRTFAPRPEGLETPILTGLARVPAERRFVLQVSGYGILRALPVPMRLLRAGDDNEIALDLRFEDAPEAFGPFDTYASFRRFGSALPYTTVATAFDGAAPKELLPGEYVLVVGETDNVRSIPFTIFD